MKIIKEILIKIGLYYRLRYSNIYQYYIYKKTPSIAINEQKEISFLTKLLPPNKLVFDIGANNGDFTSMYLKLGSTVVAVEPDKTNIQILKARFGGNQNVILLGKAVSNEIGTEELFINGDGSGFNTMSEKWKSSLQDPEINRWRGTYNFIKSYRIQTTTVDDMISIYGSPFFIKIDVEGYEHKVITSLTKKINLINFEANLPEFHEETILCVKHLAGIYDEYKFNICDERNFVFDVWKNHMDFCEYVKATTRRYLDIWVTADRTV